jgi:hypothetical protein
MEKYLLGEINFDLKKQKLHSLYPLMRSVIVFIGVAREVPKEIKSW